MKEKNEQPKISVFDILEKQYNDAKNKTEIDFWRPFTKIIVESLEIRSKKGLSQKDLAHLMETKQSAISRFENMGRKPNYEFLARLASSLGHTLGLTLYGDFMAIVPEDKQDLIEMLAKHGGVSTAEFTQALLDNAIEGLNIIKGKFEKSKDTTNSSDFLLSEEYSFQEDYDRSDESLGLASPYPSDYQSIA